MGDRVSISFVNEAETWGRESVVLFSHWGGPEFAQEAQDWADKLTDEQAAHLAAGGSSDPLARLEPSVVMAEYVRQVGNEAANRTYSFAPTPPGHIRSDLYLGATTDDGDNSDNGHFRILLGRKPEDRTPVTEPETAVRWGVPDLQGIERGTKLVLAVDDGVNATRHWLAKVEDVRHPTVNLDPSGTVTLELLAATSATEIPA